MWAPLVFAWLFNLWALYLLRKEYEAVSQMRLTYLAHQKRAPNQFTVTRSSEREGERERGAERAGEGREKVVCVKSWVPAWESHRLRSRY